MYSFYFKCKLLCNLADRLQCADLVINHNNNKTFVEGRNVCMDSYLENEKGYGS